MPFKQKNERDGPPSPIWAVVSGEYHKGYNTVGVFTSKAEAVLCAEDSMRIGEWEEEDPAARWKEGCSYIEIHEDRPGPATRHATVVEARWKLYDRNPADWLAEKRETKTGV